MEIYKNLMQSETRKTQKTIFYIQQKICGLVKVIASNSFVVVRRNK